MGRNVKSASAERKGGKPKGPPKTVSTYNIKDDLLKKIEKHARDQKISLTDVANDAFKTFFGVKESDQIRQNAISKFDDLLKDKFIVDQNVIDQTYQALEHSFDYLMLLAVTIDGPLGMLDKDGGLKRKLAMRRLETIAMFMAFTGGSEEEATSEVDTVLQKERAESAENRRLAVENAQREHAEILAQEALASAQTAAKPGLLNRIVSKIVK